MFAFSFVSFASTDSIIIIFFNKYTCQNAFTNACDVKNTNQLYLVIIVMIINNNHMN